MNKPRRNNPGGFTLLEVLVALTVVALALTAMIKSTGEVTANVAYLQEKTRAHWIAMDRITELRINREWPTTGSKRDDVEMYGVDWRWVQDVSETSVEDMRRVEVSVYLTEYGDEDHPLATMTGFLPNPRLLKPREQARREREQQEQRGQRQPGQRQPGQRQPGQRQPGQRQPGQRQPGQRQPGQRQPGQRRPGQRRPGQRR